MNTTILLKPHHFLDIIKLYGFGLSLFIPDPKYGHNFYKVGNLILKSPKAIIILTAGSDDICKSCKFLKNGKCTDKIKNFTYSSKDEWNQKIDKRIFKHLNLKEKDSLTALGFFRLARKRLTTGIITQIWHESPEKETKKRIKYLLDGLNKYIQKFSA